MNLRARITLFVSLCILILIGGMQLAAIWRQETAETRYAGAMVSGVRNTWNGLTEIGLRRLDDLAPALARQQAAARALENGDDAGLKAALTQALVAFAGAKAPPSVEVTDAAGALRFSSEGSKAPDVLTAPALERLAEAGRSATTVRGVAVNARGEAVLTAAETIQSNGRVLGSIAVFVSVNPLTTDFTRAADTPVFLLNGEKLVGASDQEFWSGLGAFAAPSEDVARVKLQGKVFETVQFTVADALRDERLTVLTMRDVTQASHRDFVIGLLSQGLTLAVVVLFLAFLYWYMRTSFRPLNAVIRVLNALARGNTQVSLPFTPRADEIGRLAGTVENFRQGQEARGRLTTLEQELDLARNIQASFLSTDFPTLDGVEMFATMIPAKEVGGDFYDFFSLPDGRFAVVIADVSGKGVGAAMFMTVARTVIRSTAQVVDDPGACLARANDLLSLENAANMFVTVFYGVLDPATGRFIYCNAGHNPPVLVRPDGEPEFLPISGDAALGVMDGLDYDSRELTLEPGSFLALYTDGVTEAFNPHAELFGEARLLQSLATVRADAPEETIRAVVGDVTRFADGAPQSDDITCLTLRFQPATAGAERAKETAAG